MKTEEKNSVRASIQAQELARAAIETIKSISTAQELASK
jgi:hypothetical protein